jgi:hypothetical protein
MRNEVELILKHWGKSTVVFKRWIALFMCLCTASLGRFSDMKIPAHAVILPPPATSGAEICMAKRKNRQKGEAFWSALPPSGTRTLMRRLLRERGYQFGDEGEVLGAGTDFLLPRIVHDPSSGRHAGFARFDCEVTDKPLDKSQYKTYLKLIRRALRECCGFSKAQADLFGTHSFRRTGDSMMRREGKTQCERQGAGAWVHKSSETAYSDLSIGERVRLFGASCV